jgi:hypothetical protein
MRGGVRLAETVGAMEDDVAALNHAFWLRGLGGDGVEFAALGGGDGWRDGDSGNSKILGCANSM